MPDPNITSLLHKFFSGSITAEEKHTLSLWIEESGDEEGLKDLLEKYWYQFEPKERLTDEKANQLLSVILQRANAERTTPAKTVRMSGLRRWRGVAAAAVILLIGATAYLISNKKSAAKIAVQQPAKQADIAPGRDGAILILADGKQIVLDSAGNGNLARQENMRIVKSGNEVSYVNIPDAASQSVAFNEVRTPNGRQFHLKLSDGSKVWLNAASSIRFPASFSDKERNVEITGETYFEVAYDPSRPFHVSVNGMDIQVLGTHFNINAYNDEPVMKTTLLEGSVRLKKDGRLAILKPGEQAQAGSELTILKDVNTEEVMAWKNGFFQFDGMGIQSVMRQLERWYDVKVSYEGVIPERQFAGQIDRNANLSEVLKILQESRIHFKIQNRNLIVMP